MTDWIGLLFFLFLIFGAILGLRILSRPRKTTSDEFERKVAEGPGVSGAFVNALQDAIDPAASKGKETVVQMKDGNFQKKKREGKANAGFLDLEETSNERK